MKKNLLHSHAFYIGFTEDFIYSSKYQLSMKVINNSVLIKYPEQFNTLNFPSDSFIYFDDLPNYFRNILMLSISFISKNPMDQFNSINLRYTSISKDGIDNMDGLLRNIRFKIYHREDENSPGKKKNLSIFTIREDVLQFATKSLSNILMRSPLNSQILINIYIANPKFIK